MCVFMGHPVRVYRCTSLYGTPTMFIDMLHLPNFEQFSLTSLYTGIYENYMEDKLLFFLNFSDFLRGIGQVGL